MCLAFLRFRLWKSRIIDDTVDMSCSKPSCNWANIALRLGLKILSFSLVLVSFYIYAASALPLGGQINERRYTCAEIFAHFKITPPPIETLEVGDLVANLGKNSTQGYLRYAGKSEFVRTPYLSWDFPARYEIFPKDVRDPRSLKDKSIADIGSNSGNFINGIIQQARFQGIHLKKAFTLDIEPTGLNVKRGDFFKSNIETDSMDILYSSHSIFMYEVRNPELLKKLFQEAKRILRSGGKLLITPVKPDFAAYYKKAIEEVGGISITERSTISDEVEIAPGQTKSGSHAGFFEFLFK